MIYYLPGWGGQLRTGLGQAFLDRGLNVTGRETREEFIRMTFSEQVATVAEDLKQHFWSSESRVVANSFGAYIFLNALVQLGEFPGKTLLLSPIVSGFEDPVSGRNFSPPQDGRIVDLALTGGYPTQFRCVVHTGSEDWQSKPDVVQRFFASIGKEVCIAPGRCHMLGADYVSPVIDAWLES